MYNSSGTRWLGWFMCSECRDVIEFRCDNGRCVASMLTCDGRNDCGDYSDEIRPCSALLRLLFSFIKHSWNQVFRSRVTRVNDFRALSLISGQSPRHDYWLSLHGQTADRPNAKVYICFQNCQPCQVGSTGQRSSVRVQLRVKTFDPVPTTCGSKIWSSGPHPSRSTPLPVLFPSPLLPLLSLPILLPLPFPVTFVLFPPFPSLPYPLVQLRDLGERCNPNKYT